MFSASAICWAESSSTHCATSGCGSPTRWATRDALAFAEQYASRRASPPPSRTSPLPRMLTARDSRRPGPRGTCDPDKQVQRAFLRFSRQTVTGAVAEFDRQRATVRSPLADRETSRSAAEVGTPAWRRTDPSEPTLSTGVRAGKANDEACTTDLSAAYSVEQKRMSHGFCATAYAQRMLDGLITEGRKSPLRRAPADTIFGDVHRSRLSSIYGSAN